MIKYYVFFFFFRIYICSLETEALTKTEIRRPSEIYALYALAVHVQRAYSRCVFLSNFVVEHTSLGIYRNNYGWVDTFITRVVLVHERNIFSIQRVKRHEYREYIVTNEQYKYYDSRFDNVSTVKDKVRTVQNILTPVFTDQRQ